MEKFDRLCDLVKTEIDKEVAKGVLTPDTVRTIGYGIDILKDIKTIEAMEEAEHEGYSGHYPNYAVRPWYSYEEMPMDRSYARRRDSMGRYSRDSRVDQLERMMAESHDENERDMLRKLINHMEN